MERTVRSRRAVLAAAIGGAAAAATAGLIRPEGVRADSSPLMTEVDNPTGPTTSISSGYSSVDDVAFQVSIADLATGIRGISPSGVGVKGENTAGGAGVLGTSSNGATGVAGFSGDPANYPGVGDQAGVFGYGTAPAGNPDALNEGVLGIGNAVGVWGAAAIGVVGQGAPGVFGFGDGLGPPGQYATGLYGYSGDNPPSPPNNVGVFAAAGATGTALQVVGKVRFDRAGKATIKKGQSKYKKTLAGATTSSQIFAVLRTYRSGTHVAAVVPHTGYFYVYLNKALTADTDVSYFVVN